MRFDDAACLDLPHLFFDHGRGNWNTIREAKALCAECPHLEECRDYAVDMAPTTGIWGGLSVKELQRLRLERGGFGPRTCVECGATFQPSRSIHVYCSDGCNKVRQSRRESVAPGRSGRMVGVPLDVLE